MRGDPAALRFGKVIREMRLARKWTQEDLAAELDADAAYISRIERGIKNPSLETVLKLAAAFRVKILFGDRRL